MSSKDYEHHRKSIVSKGIPSELLERITDSDVKVINTFLTRVGKLELTPKEKKWIVSVINSNGFCGEV